MAVDKVAQASSPASRPGVSSDYSSASGGGTPPKPAGGTPAPHFVHRPLRGQAGFKIGARTGMSVSSWLQIKFGDKAVRASVSPFFESTLPRGAHLRLLGAPNGSHFDARSSRGARSVHPPFPVRDLKRFEVRAPFWLRPRGAGAGSDGPDAPGLPASRRSGPITLGPVAERCAPCLICLRLWARFQFFRGASQ